MRLFKLLLTLVILCLIGIFIYENMSTWTQSVSFKLNLYLNENHDTAALRLYLVIAISAAGGFIIGLSTLLGPYFRTRRMLKRERQEKKQAKEEVASKQTIVESNVEAASTPVQANQMPGNASE